MDSDQRTVSRTFSPISVSTAHVLIALWLQNCCRGNRMEMGIIMYSWYWRPGGCGAGSLGTTLYPEPDVSGQNHSTQDSSGILRSYDRIEGGRPERERERKTEGREEKEGGMEDDGKKQGRTLEANNGGRMTSDLKEKEEAKVMLLQNPSETSKDKRSETWGR